MNQAGRAKQENKFQKRVLTIPNILSLFRIVLIPVFLWLYASERHAASGAVLVLSGVTDVADGFIARRFRMVSDLGKVLDPVADKLTLAAVLICLLIRFPQMLLPLGALVVKETYMAISGLQVIRKAGIVLGAEWHGKAATVLLYGAILTHIFWDGISTPVSAACIAACTIMIVVSLVLYAVRNTKALAKAKNCSEGIRKKSTRNKEKEGEMEN